VLIPSMWLRDLREMGNGKDDDGVLPLNARFIMSCLASTPGLILAKGLDVLEKRL